MYTMEESIKNNISRFHYITQDDVDGYAHEQLVEEACRGGVDWVQLRIKAKGYEEHLQIAYRVKNICEKYRVKLIINDSVNIAKEVGAEGVHLGKEDMLPEKARFILGPKVIIGATANTQEDIRRLVPAKVNYIGLGPFRYTSTKKNLSPVLGQEGIREVLRNIKKEMQIPIIAIGGINLEDIDQLMELGIYGVAVSSAINLSEDKMSMTRLFINKLMN